VANQYCVVECIVNTKPLYILDIAVAKVFYGALCANVIQD